MIRLRNITSPKAVSRNSDAAAIPNQPQEAHRNTSITVYGRGSLLSDLIDCDFVSFLAIVQSLHVPLFEFKPVTSYSQKKGSRIILPPPQLGVVFKSEPDLAVKDVTLMNKTLLSEILVLQHPVLGQHPNIQQLLGVTWRPIFHETTFLRVLPYLVFERSTHDTLWIS